MTLWAIVPVKPLRRGKSRLSGVLNEDQRTELNRCLLVHTLDVLAAVAEIEHTLVVSRDPQALALARDHGARTVQEHGLSQLNLALSRATIVAASHAVLGVLVLPADLPLLTGEDVQALIERSKQPPVMVIAPDRHGKGTNALLVCPVGMIPFSFGDDSFEKHSGLAGIVGMRLEICERPNLALDVDLPEDLEMVHEALENMKAYDSRTLELIES
jgi:2-phospho-L-lactate guanylyltransferase